MEYLVINPSKSSENELFEKINDDINTNRIWYFFNIILLILIVKTNKLHIVTRYKGNLCFCCEFYNKN